MESTSRTAATAAGFGAAAALVSILGPLGAWSGVFFPMLGFGLLALGLLLAVLAVVLGLIGLWTTRPSTGRRGRGRAIVGTCLGLVLVFGIGSSRGDGDRRADFNDITTDLADPPAFSHAQELDPNRGRDLEYPPEFAAKQLELYPDLAPIRVTGSTLDAYRRAENSIGQLGWSITWGDGVGTIEATDTSAIFRFVDDIVIRIRPGDGAATIDMRSKSRDGRGDLGVNADRIRAFRAALAE